MTVATETTLEKPVSSATDAAGETSATTKATGKAATNATKHTPMMQQYQAMRRSLPKDVLLFYRMGDFYEMFYEDAKVAAAELGITLTSRSKGDGAIPMAGVPAKSYQAYLQKLEEHPDHVVDVGEVLARPEQSRERLERGVDLTALDGPFDHDRRGRQAGVPELRHERRELVGRLGIPKGGMTLIDGERAEDGSAGADDRVATEDGGIRVDDRPVLDRRVITLRQRFTGIECADALVECHVTVC